jgi:hypothetical protein
MTRTVIVVVRGGRRSMLFNCKGKCIVATVSIDFYKTVKS